MDEELKSTLLRWIDVAEQAASELPAAAEELVVYEIATAGVGVAAGLALMLVGACVGWRMWVRGCVIEDDVTEFLHDAKNGPGPWRAKNITDQLVENHSALAIAGAVSWMVGFIAVASNAAPLLKAVLAPRIVVLDYLRAAL